MVSSKSWNYSRIDLSTTSGKERRQNIKHIGFSEGYCQN